MPGIYINMMCIDLHANINTMCIPVFINAYKCVGIECKQVQISICVAGGRGSSELERDEVCVLESYDFNLNPRFTLNGLFDLGQLLTFLASPFLIRKIVRDYGKD